MVTSERIARPLLKSVSISPLIAFRIIFGALATFSAVRFMYYGWVDSLYIQPKFHFHYTFFEWINPLEGNWMYLPFILMVFAGLGILFGFLYRFSTVIYFLAFTYIELLDKTTYLNHYYFVSIITFLLIWLPANADLSLDVRWFGVKRKQQIAAWSIWILRFQLGLVYFYAGLAKINTDWLIEAMPLKIWLPPFRDLPIVGFLFTKTWLAYAFSWFGCVYDLTIPFFLMTPKTRNWAYFFVIAFHVLTWYLFPIGVFPWVMIGATLIFFPASFHDKWLRFFRKRSSGTVLSYRKPKNSKLIVGFIIVFAFFQIIIPFRYLLHSGPLFWYEEGFRFSWRVMLMEKKGYITFYVKDKSKKGSIMINNSDYLTDFQIDQMSRQPDMILEFAHFLGDKYRDTLLISGKDTVHLHADRIEAEGFVTLNGKMHEAYVSRKHNLLNISKFQSYNSWVEAPSH
jgi:hypothetical protein